MKLAEIMESLNVPSRDATTFFHISIEALGGIALASTALKEIRSYFDGRSTLCMPSYPFFGAGYFAWMESLECFDVKKTPSRVNFMSEIFRRTPDVERSLHPWCSVACQGYRAKELVYEHHLSEKTFGEKSPFSKIAKMGGFVVGLGVNCNTNSFAHLPDDFFLNQYPFCVYEEAVFEKKCIDATGCGIIVKTDILHRDISKAIRPINLREQLLAEPFYHEMSIDGISFYAMQVQSYVDFVCKLNEEDLKKNILPRYYQQGMDR